MAIVGEAEANVRGLFPHEQIVSHDAISISVDFAHATGGQLPTIDNLDNLYENDRLAFPVPEVMRACECESIEEFHELVGRHYCDDVERRLAERRSWLAEIEQKRLAGEVPDIIFREVIATTSDELRSRAARGEAKLHRDMGTVLEAEVDDDKKIDRYLKWNLLDKLLFYRQDKLGLDSIDEVASQERRENIVLGLTRDKGKLTGKLLSSYSSAVANVVGSTSAYIQLEAQTEGYLDYISPVLRKKVLSSTVDSANKSRWPAPELAYFDTKRGRLLGAIALKSYLAREDKPGHIVHLGELLIQRGLELDFKNRNPYEYNSWSRKDIAIYGRWLLKLVETQGEELNIYVLRNAYRLGIGPGESVGSDRNYGSLEAFYQTVGRRKLPRGLFDSWDDAAWIAWIRDVAEQNNGEVSEAILSQRKEQGFVEPSPKIIDSKQHSLTDLKKRAGLKVYNRTVSAEDILAAAVDFVIQNGRVINRGDLGSTSPMRSTHPTYKHFGSIKNLNAQILLRLREKCYPLEAMIE